MEIIVLPTADEVGELAARKVAAVLRMASPGVLGLATGSSPMSLYSSLKAMTDAGELDLSAVRGFALDEYLGIPAQHPQSYAGVIAREVVEPLGMDPALVQVPDGRAEDPDAACREYERAIRDAGGVDIQILGIGANGHIGFNEPTSSFASRTRVKTLAPGTRADNARFFDDPAEVPTHCLTQGLGTVLDARHLLLVAQGEGKADAVRRAVEGPVSSMCPGSALQLHEHATVIVDEAAASGLELLDYYRYTYVNKPEWQRY